VNADIFEFWSGLPGNAHYHPADRVVLERVKPQFRLDCLVAPFMGRLRTAPVVLLFLSPGFVESDRSDASSATAQAYYARRRIGDCDLPSEQEHASALRWAKPILRQFALEYDSVRSTVAFLDIAAYKSRGFRDWKMLTALPSCRVTLD